MDTSHYRYFSLFQGAGGYGAVIAEDAGLVEITLPFSNLSRDEITGRIIQNHAGIRGENRLTRGAAKALTAYFAGESPSFDFPLLLSNCTEFNRAVYEFVQKIPYGSVRSYGEVAAAIGHPGAARGVGGAMAANRLPIITPCHRVVSSTGQMTGFSAAGGIESKLYLLRLEKVVISPEGRAVLRKK